MSLGLIVLARGARAPPAAPRSATTRPAPRRCTARAGGDKSQARGRPHQHMSREQLARTPAPALQRLHLRRVTAGERRRRRVAMAVTSSARRRGFLAEHRQASRCSGAYFEACGRHRRHRQLHHRHHRRAAEFGRGLASGRSPALPPPLPRPTGRHRTCGLRRRGRGGRLPASATTPSRGLEREGGSTTRWNASSDLHKTAFAHDEGGKSVAAGKTKFERRIQ